MRIKQALAWSASYLGVVAVALSLSITPNLALAADNLAIEEITVTARKKDESIQDVPLAVSAITDQL